MNKNGKTFKPLFTLEFCIISIIMFLAGIPIGLLILADVSTYWGKDYIWSLYDVLYIVLGFLPSVLFVSIFFISRHVKKVWRSYYILIHSSLYLIGFLVSYFWIYQQTIHCIFIIYSIFLAFIAVPLLYWYKINKNSIAKFCLYILSICFLLTMASKDGRDILLIPVDLFLMGFQYFGIIYLIGVILYLIVFLLIKHRLKRKMLLKSNIIYSIIFASVLPYLLVLVPLNTFTFAISLSESVIIFMFVLYFVINVLFIFSAIEIISYYTEADEKVFATPFENNVSYLSEDNDDSQKNKIQELK